MCIRDRLWPYISKLGEKRVKFVPRSITYFAKDLPYPDLPNGCLKNGIYCAERRFNFQISGTSIIEESLRQKCLYWTQPWKWFDFMMEFKNPCLYVGTILSLIHI
eukprot:TRINITY_DN18613_c0_g1_i1.p3 TRINITY_DN18613_c0_g1~~TRINITY_DN18613_c0_g1_i1.p3  ORF type:complete len:117 (-),score=24.69 TRINITY_DN18613_c0_g1_i1:5-319(-)